MTALDWLAVGCTVAACAALAWADPAQRVQRWWRRRKDAQAPGDVGHATQVQRGGEGAAPAVVAPSPVALFCGCEVVVDREIQVTPAVALGHYLSRASKASMVRA